MAKGKKFLSDLKLYTDYFKWQENKGRYENWEEACESVLDTHREKYGAKIEPLLDEVRPLYYDKVVLASQRNLQYRGNQIFKHNPRMYNCSTNYCYSPDIFSKGFYVLLCGTGLGVSMRKKYVSQLPNIYKPTKNTKTFTVPDSIEGWAEALHVLISSFCKHDSLESEYFGHKIIFDFSQVRPKGAFISGGFRAPSADGLRQSLERIESLLLQELSENTNIEFRGIIAYDIFMHASDAVLSGGVRRSAMNILIDKDDEELIKAKTGNWRQTHPWRARSNNSVGLIRGEFTKEEFEYFVNLNSGDNDIGFVFTDSEDVILNPCYEISFDFYNEIPDRNKTAFQFCVAGDTKLITKHSIETIQDCVGKEIEVWNGVEWSKVEPYITGDSDELYRVYFTDGSYLDATNNHKFLVKNRFEEEYKEVTTLELQKLLEDSTYTIHVPRANINNFDWGGVKEVNSYDYGFVLGDGFIPHKRVEANLYNEDKKLNFNTVTKIGSYKNYNDKEFTHVYFDLDYKFAKNLKYNHGLPPEIFKWDRESILYFIAGWADADGSNSSKGIRIYGDYYKLKDAQLLLTKCGINSSLNLMGKKGKVTNLGVRKNDIWYLQVTKTIDIPCQRLKCDNPNDPTKKGKFQIVKSVTQLEGLHKSYCLTEKKLNQCVFNNVLTKQCNLNEIIASELTSTRGRFSKDKFFAACRAAAILGTLQAGYTDFPHINKQTEDIVAGEALLGVSITGWMTRPELFDAEILEEGVQIIKETNEEVANLIGINPAARTTCVKPSGNASVIAQTASGIHPEHSQRYFRIMQINKESDTAKWLLENMPEILEESKWSATNSDYVVYSPCENEEGTIYKEEMQGIKHLELIKLVQQHWVEKGKNFERSYTPYSMHNVSNTVIIDDKEAIVNYIFDNQQYFTAVSFLELFGDKDYTQAPFTSVLNTEELVDKYGKGVVFMSGLIVDGLHYFNNDLWTACDTVLNESQELVGTREQLLLRKDWIKRVKNFSKNYFDSDLKKTIYCMKDVHLWHKWNNINRSFKRVDFSKILTQPTYNDVSKYASVACSGGQCEI